MGGARKKHKREHSRDRHRDHRRKSRSRSASPSEYRRRRSASRTRREERRHRTRSRSPADRVKDYKKDGRPTAAYTNVRVEDKNATDNLTKEEREMRRLMGFCNFDTTKGKSVVGNDVGDVHLIVKRKYRQYMNRKGGFNRPLDFVA